MAAPYILTIESRLTPPRNLANISRQISRQLSDVSASIGLRLSPQALSELTRINAQLNNVQRTARRAEDTMEGLGAAAAQTFKRFAGFTLIIATIYKFISAVQTGISEVVELDKEFTQIRQVANDSRENIRKLSDEVFRLSTSLGVSSKELASASQILVQAGLSIDDTRQALEALALSDLTPTFESMSQSSEGLIAAMNQFNLPASKARDILGSMNAVAAKFAVESQDLVSATQKAGGAFAAAGGELNELLALFTSVRSTTRESADSIATGFRTIFARLQRPKTLSFLETLGIELSEAGQFKGPIEAIGELNQALSQLSSTDVRFAQIVEELGGIRQISRVIPLIQEFPKAIQALFVAEQGASQLARDALRAQDSFANSITRTREEFIKLIAAFASDSSVREFSKGTLDAAQSLAKLLQPLSQLAPLLAAGGLSLVGTQGSRFLGEFAGGLGFTNRREVRGNRFPGGNTGGPLGGLGLVGGSLVLEQLLSKFGLLNDATSGVVKTIGQFGTQLLAVSTTLGFVFSQISRRSEARVTTLQDRVRLRSNELEGQRGTAATLIRERARRAAELRATDVAVTNQQRRVQTSNLQATFGLIPPDQARADVQRLNRLLHVERTQSRSLLVLNREISTRQRNIASLSRLNDSQNRQIDTIQRTIAALDLINISASLISATFLTLGNGLESRGRAELQLGNRSGTGAFRSGRTLQSGGFGIAAGVGAGAAIGSVFGGVGAVPGAIAGGVIGGTGGAIGGLVTSAEEAKRILETVEFEKGIKSLTTTLNDVISGQAVAELQGGFVGSQLARARESLRTANVEDKEGRLGAIENLLVPLNSFVGSVAQGSKTFDELATKVGPDVIQFLAEFSDIPISKLRSRLESLIGTSIKLNQITENLANLRLREFQRAEEVNIFVGAIRDSVDAVKIFNSQLSGGFLDQGATFGRVGSIGDSARFASIVSQTLSPLGSRANALSSEAAQIPQLGRILPNALLTAASADPFGAGQGIVDRIEEALEGASPFIIQSIAARAEEILGGAATDEKLVRAIQDNPAELARQLLVGFNDNILSALTDINSGLVEFTNDLIGLADQRKQAELGIIDIVQDSINTREGRAEFRADFAGRRLGIGARLGFDRLRQGAILGGDAGLAGSPSAIGTQIQSSERRVRELNLRLQTSEIANRGELIVQIANEKERIDRLNNSLKFLGDATARASSLQDELNRKRGERETRRDIFTEFITSGAEGRSRISRGIAGASSLRRGGRLSSLDEETRGLTVDFLKRLGEGLFGGERAKDILDKAITAEGGGSFVKPTAEEARLAAAIDGVFATALEAQTTLLVNAQTNSDIILGAIRDNTALFLTKIDDLIKSGERERTQSQISRVGAQLGATRGQLGAIGQISQISGLRTPEQIEKLRNLLPAITQIQQARASQTRGSEIGRFSNALSGIPLSSLDLGGKQSADSLSSRLGGLGFNLEVGSTRGGVTNRPFATFSEAQVENLRKQFTERFGEDTTQSIFSGLDNVERIKPGQISGQGLAGFLQSRFQNLSEQQRFNIDNNQSEIQRVRQNLGGNVNIESLINNADNLKKLFDGLPSNIGGVSTEFQKLQQQLITLQQQLGSTFNADTLNGLSGSIAAFNTAVTNIPTDIAMNATHTVDVRINGAEAFASMQSTMRDLVVRTTQNEINKMLQKKFPDLGTV
jgi:TP901 family phage tail tape measure protein